MAGSAGFGADHASLLALYAAEATTLHSVPRFALYSVPATASLSSPLTPFCSEAVSASKNNTYTTVKTIVLASPSHLFFPTPLHDMAGLGLGLGRSSVQNTCVDRPASITSAVPQDLLHYQFIGTIVTIVQQYLALDTSTVNKIRV